MTQTESVIIPSEGAAGAICCMCCSCYCFLLDKSESRALQQLGSPLKVQAGCPPSLLCQQVAGEPAAATSPRLLPSSPATAESGSGEGDVPAARSHQSQLLTEELNLLSASAPAADSDADSNHESLETALCMPPPGVAL